MANELTYRTVQGDRFTWIAYRIFGSSRYTSTLMRMNPSYADIVLFDAGVTLTVPQVTARQNLSNTSWGTFFQLS
jgi:phage tail protein X